ncbi:SEP-domain-containing [Pyrrhoderma noxium]|uniref:SEP-domain-containing n=1 Tax=Pyrrhoderma noxium TaxID=2282107 RepID=A0A286U617_9AGAM|nr:SEP-domain-containing [Pyrrhoderma noxium]
MSDHNNNPRPRPTNQGPRIGRIGQWGGSSNSNSGRSSSGRRIATLSDIGSESGPSFSADFPTQDDQRGDNEEEENNEGQNWFTGGERSGLSVQNPNSRQRVPGGDIVKNLLQRAEQHGRPPVPEDDGQLSPFSGAGNTLGSDEIESRVVPDPNAASSSAPTESVVRHITFWRNGFTVGDGPLMDYDVPENAEILRSIEQGQAPPALLNVRYGQPVELRVLKKVNEDYVEPERPHRAFDGTGHRLGAPTPPIGGSSASTSQASASTSSSTAEADIQSVQTKFEVDQTQPTTSIQIRLADGTRMICRMNLTHTVQDILNFINASRPENRARAYTIATIRPNRILEDPAQTIQAAGLENTVVVQRWV